MPERKANRGNHAERGELEALLASGIFDRAPLLSSFLKYICEMYFDGEADAIKEYSIATDALGRSEDFDHTRDSIVRVEAHRLRKRLKQYYQGPGADHKLQIRIPSGQYVPKFVPVRVDIPAPAGEAATTSSAAPVPHSRTWFGVALGALLAIAAFAVWSVSTAEPDISRTVAADLPDPRPEAIYRISAGLKQGRFVDSSGAVWERDEFFNGGDAMDTAPPQELSGLSPRLFATGRFGRFEYALPLAQGGYEVRLYFAETRPAQHLNFNILANGAPLLQNFQPTGSAGARGTAEVRVFAAMRPADDGFLRLAFRPRGVLNGFEVLSSGDVIHPIRVLSGQQSGHHDRLGRFWTGDRFYRGGMATNRSQRVSGTLDPDLFTGERYGDFSYVLPVAPGKYTLRLIFAETWYGQENPEKGGRDSRIFHVICNGKKILRNFDIYSEAGGENRAVLKEFKGIEADAHGKVVVKFVPLRGLACVNAIELVQEDG